MGHYYDKDGKPCHTVPVKSNPGKFRDTTPADALKLGLVPSVSEILNFYGNAEKLIDWKAREAVVAFMENPSLTPDQCVKSVDGKVGTFADDGTEAHRILECYMQGEFVESDRFTHKQINNFIQRLETLFSSLGGYIRTPEGNMALATEQTFTSLEEGYGGSVDLQIEFKDFFLVSDYKFKQTKPGKPIFKPPTNILQLNAYRKAILDLDTPLSRAWIVGDKPVLCANIYISLTEWDRPAEISLYKVEDGKVATQIFMRLRDIWWLTYAGELYRDRQNRSGVSV